jgi:adenylosuccinate lyase
MFLFVGALLILLGNISSGLVVYLVVIQQRVDEKLPFMTTELVIMATVDKRGIATGTPRTYLDPVTPGRRCYQGTG